MPRKSLATSSERPARAMVTKAPLPASQSANR